jgi:hypothetical protein
MVPFVNFWYWETRSTHTGRWGRFRRPLVVQRLVFAGHIRNHGSDPLLLYRGGHRSESDHGNNCFIAKHAFIGLCENESTNSNKTNLEARLSRIHNSNFKTLTIALSSLVSPYKKAETYRLIYLWAVPASVLTWVSTSHRPLVERNLTPSVQSSSQPSSKQGGLSSILMATSLFLASTAVLFGYVGCEEFNATCDSNTRWKLNASGQPTCLSLDQKTMTSPRCAKLQMTFPIFAARPAELQNVWREPTFWSLKLQQKWYASLPPFYSSLSTLRLI